MILRGALLGGASLIACSTSVAWAQSSANVQSAPQSTAGSLTAPQASQANTSGASASPATAAPTPLTGNTSASSGAQVQEVIVTARRRAENLQNVPVAVTAVSGATLEKQSITTAYDLPRVAPSLNVNISAGGGQNQSQFTIRGQRQGDTLPSVDPAVGVYLGDIVFERPFGFSQSLFDLSNVQVLKGPQGTLFGRATTGGDIVVQPNLPTDKYEGSIHASLGDYNLHEVDGYVNLPLNDKAQLRIAAQHTDRDGYITDVSNGQDEEDENESAVRISLKLTPIEKLVNTTVINYITRDTNGTGFKLDYLNPNSSAGEIYGAAGQAVLGASKNLGFYQTDSGSGPEYAHIRTSTIANTTTYAINENITLKNIVGYIHSKANFFDDIDGSPLPILAYSNANINNQITEEFQVLGKTRNFNWIVGGYYFREGAFEESFTPDELNPVITGYLIPQEIPENDTNTSRSVFGSGTYDFSQFIPHLSATFGGRYTWDTREANFGTINAAGFTPGQATGNPVIPISPGQQCGFAIGNMTAAATGQPLISFNPNTCKIDEKADFSHFTYNVDVDYKITPDKLIYFAHRLGYRPGGFGTREITSFDIEYQPDVVNDYELGAKFDWRYRGMFLRTNLAGYYQDYSGLQRLVPVEFGQSTITTVQNVGHASINGAEAEFTFIPRSGINITGFFSQTQPTYESFLIKQPDGSTVDATHTAAFAGFPRTTFGVTGRFDLPTPEQYGGTVLQINYYHQSPYIGQDAAASEADGTTPGYGLMNLRVEWNGVFGTKLDMAGFVNNALDHQYIAVNYSLANEVGFASTVAGAPRMFGFEGRYHFGG